MQSLFNQLIFPLDTLLKQEMKHEQRRLMEKAMRQYDALMYALHNACILLHIYILL